MPQDIQDLVKAAKPDFQISEVLKKVRDGRTYYDVEGELANGDEIEFDVLMSTKGPQIVEIQRDLKWESVPSNVQLEAIRANTDSHEITRIIESVQTDDAVIYEIFVAGTPSDPRFEIWTKNGEIKLLPMRWKH